MIKICIQDIIVLVSLSFKFSLCLLLLLVFTKLYKLVFVIPKNLLLRLCAQQVPG